MKKALILFLAAIVVATAWGQQATYDKLKAKSVMEIPKYASLSAATSAGSIAGNLVYVYATSDSGFKVRNIANTGWISIPLEGSGGTTYQAGNGIKIVGDTLVRLADTLISSNTVLVVPSFKTFKIKNFGTSAARTEIYSGFGSINLDYYNSSDVLEGYFGLYSGGIDIVHASKINLGSDSSEILLNNRTLNLYGRDSIRFYSQSYGVYSAATISASKYKVVLMDSLTGAMVTASPNLLKSQNSGTPSSTADSQGTQGDMLYDDSYIYIKTSAGWKRVSLSSF